MEDIFISPLLLAGVAIVPAALSVVGTAAYFFNKVPETKFFLMLRHIKKTKLMVRIHYQNNFEAWVVGYKKPTGELFIYDDKGAVITLDPRHIHQSKNSFRAGIEIVDVYSKSIWPVGATEAIRVNEIDDYVNALENNCPRLKAMDELTRHTVLACPPGQLHERVKGLVSIDDNGLISITEVASLTEETYTERLQKHNQAVEGEVNAIIDEVNRIHKGLEGRVMFDRVFSWADAGLALNSQLKQDTIKEMEWYLINIHKKDNDPTALIKLAIIAAIVIVAIGGVIWLLKGG
ncbi:hypothetical protein [Methanocella sp. MCL-LM]|uniref:hypothetical protein n=1 Tax=Methanocella sp. MCL-LM TaxID=3412035 RepID=UPI003C73B762